MDSTPQNNPAEITETASELLRRLNASIDELDKPAAVSAALGAVDEGRIDVPNLYTQVLGPYLAAVGSRWQHGAERVWQEHFASHVVRTIVEALYPRVLADSKSVPVRGETVLLVCPPAEEHELGLRMLADRFQLAGYRAIFLGADTPVAEIVSAGETVRASYVAISVSTVIERVELRGFVDAVRTGLPGAKLVLGGPAFCDNPAEYAGDAFADPAELGLPGMEPGA